MQLEDKFYCNTTFVHGFSVFCLAQYFPKASLYVVVPYGQNDDVDALTIHQLHRLVQKSTWTFERPLAWSPSHPYLCGDICEMDLKGGLLIG